MWIFKAEHLFKNKLRFYADLQLVQVRPGIGDPVRPFRIRHCIYETVSQGPIILTNKPQFEVLL